MSLRFWYGHHCICKLPHLGVPKTLKPGSFDAPLGTAIYRTFLETSKLRDQGCSCGFKIGGALLSWVLDLPEKWRSPRLPFVNKFLNAPVNFYVTNLICACHLKLSNLKVTLLLLCLRWWGGAAEANKTGAYFSVGAMGAWAPTDF